MKIKILGLVALIAMAGCLELQAYRLHLFAKNRSSGERYDLGLIGSMDIESSSSNHDWLQLK